MTVGQLINELKKYDNDIEVGWALEYGDDITEVVCENKKVLHTKENGRQVWKETDTKIVILR